MQCALEIGLSAIEDRVSSEFLFGLFEIFLLKINNHEEMRYLAPGFRRLCESLDFGDTVQSRIKFVLFDRLLNLNEIEPQLAVAVCLQFPKKKISIEIVEEDLQENTPKSASAKHHRSETQSAKDQVRLLASET